MGTESVLTSIARGVLAETGEDFFSSLVSHLAATLKVRFTFICSCLDESCDLAHLLAFSGDRPFRSDGDYAVVGTPCQEIREREAVMHASGIRDYYPDDLWLRDSGAESYAAIRLTGSGGRLLGHMGVLHDGPLGNPETVTATLGIFSARAAGEIERMHAVEALQKERDRARAVLDVAGVAIVLIDEHERVAMINRHGCEVLELSAEQIVGRNWFDHFVPARCREKVRVVFRGLLAGEVENFGEFENPILTSAGRERLLSWRNTVLRDSRGHVIGTVAAGDDITERKQAEEALRESEQRFRAMFENAADGILIADPVTRRFLTGNRQIAELLGCPREEIPSLSVEDIHPPQDLPDVLERFAQMARGERTMAAYVPVIRRDGTMRYANVTGFHISVEGRACLVGSFRDVTERRRMVQELRESEQRFRAMTANVPGMVFQLRRSPVGEITLPYASDGGWELFHVPPEQIQAHPEALFDRKEWKAFQQSLERSASDLSHWSWEGRIRRDPHERIWVSARARPRAMDDGSILWDGVFFNITLSRERETELRKSRQELRRLAAYLQSVRELERTRIAREIHDETGQALTALKMDLVRLRARLSPEHAQLAELADGMLTSVNATLESVQRILAELRPSLLDDLGLLAAAEWQLQQFERRTGIRCQLAVPEQEPVLGDEEATALFRILQETLTNVARHAHADRVQVRLAAEGRWLVLEVQDNGQGISRKEIRGSSSFGLLGMRERAHVLGGRLSISGAKGRGTTVRVSIPAEPGGIARTA